MEENFLDQALYIRQARIKELTEEAGYIKDLPVLRQFQNLEFHNRVTFFAGENGTGKSTLLEAIAVQYGFNAEGGTRNFNFSTYESHSSLYKYLVLVKGVKRPRDGFFLRAESFYNVATELEALDREDPYRGGFQSYGGRSLHQQSHGESFLALMLNRFSGKGLYLLDEPEAALSPAKQMALLAKIHALANNDSQLIIATHSPILLACPGAAIYVFSEEGMVLTPYKQTEHYQLTRRFLENPERMLRYLLEEEES